MLGERAPLLPKVIRTVSLATGAEAFLAAKRQTNDNGRSLIATAEQIIFPSEYRPREPRERITSLVVGVITTGLIELVTVSVALNTKPLFAIPTFFLTKLALNALIVKVNN